MKLITVIGFVVNFLLVKGHVTHSTRSEDVTTVHGVDNKSGDKTRSKTFDLNGSIYLEDVIYALKHQNWTDEEVPCLNRTLLLLYSLQNFTLWAVWNWDSVSSQPQGLLYGNSYHLGNFDECMNPPWYEAQTKLRSQYCLAEVVLDGPDNVVKKRTSNPFDPYQSALNFLRYKSIFQRTLNELMWGVCVPDVCQPRSVERLIGVMLARSHLGSAGMRARISVNECQKPNQQRPYDALFYSFIGTVIFLTTLCLVCTYLTHNKRNSDRKTLRDRLIRAFDIKKNAAVLLVRGEQDINIFYGMKFITMCMIVTCHQYGIFNSVAISNGLKVDEDILGVVGKVFLHKDLAVDTFFMMSGFLMASAFLKGNKIPNLFLIMINRYMRIVVAYAIVIFYVCAIHSYTGSGPLWNRSSAKDTESCRRNWWLNLLLLNNYVDTENICLVVSWYVPCDFHFFVVTLLLFCIYRRSPSLGKILFIVITIAAIITPGVINYVNELPATQLFTHDFLKNPRSSKQFHLTYITSHTRYAAYLVGFFSGCLYTYCSTTQHLKKMNRIYTVAGTCISFVLMGAVWLTGPMFLWRSYDALESAVYAALNRPVWACGVAIFVICCSLGSLSMLKDFLSWHVFIPLSKLSYGLYLVHNIINIRNEFIIRNPQHTDYMYISAISVGVICEGTFVSLIIWLFAEAPVKNIFKICTMSNKRTNVKSEDLCESSNGNNTRGELNTGYLRDNLPTTATVEIVSSKI